MQCIRLFFLLKDNKVQHRHIQGCLMSSGIYRLLACIHYPAFLLFQPYSWEVATANYGTPWSHPILLAAAPPASIVHYVYCRSPNCSTFIRYVPCHPCLSRSLLIKESHHFQSCQYLYNVHWNQQTSEDHVGETTSPFLFQFLNLYSWLSCFLFSLLKSISQ